MYSKARGKSGSKKPAAHVPAWALYKGKDVEKLVIKYSKAGNTASQIGIILRDTYGINSIRTLTGKSVSAILAENSISKKLPDDLISLIKKMVVVKAHAEKNHKDYTALRGLQLTESKIRRMVKYYKRVAKLPADWRFDAGRMKMYLE